ncbi:MAG: hypothetical protein CM15mV38_1160 [uncultured marine virus]|jgi:hypothetical protein|nr:MAG: hypothetical protein CM15mV38_1160 [uncultured marine virus]
MLAGYGTKDMKSKKEKAKVYEKDGFWTYDGAIAGYNTKASAEAALEAGKKKSS